MHKIFPEYAQDIPKICSIFAKTMPNIYPRYEQYRPNMCPKYAQDIPVIDHIRVRFPRTGIHPDLCNQKKKL